MPFLEDIIGVVLLLKSLESRKILAKDLTRARAGFWTDISSQNEATWKGEHRSYHHSLHTRRLPAPWLRCRASQRQHVAGSPS